MKIPTGPSEKSEMVHARQGGLSGAEYFKNETINFPRFFGENIIDGEIYERLERIWFAECQMWTRQEQLQFSKGIKEAKVTRETANIDNHPLSLKMKRVKVTWGGFVVLRTMFGTLACSRQPWWDEFRARYPGAEHNAPLGVVPTDRESLERGLALFYADSKLVGDPNRRMKPDLGPPPHVCAIEPPAKRTKRAGTPMARQEHEIQTSDSPNLIPKIDVKRDHQLGTTAVQTVEMEISEIPQDINQERNTGSDSDWLEFMANANADTVEPKTRPPENVQELKKQITRQQALIEEISTKTKKQQEKIDEMSLQTKEQQAMVDIMSTQTKEQQAVIDGVSTEARKHQTVIDEMTTKIKKQQEKIRILTNQIESLVESRDKTEEWRKVVDDRMKAIRKKITRN